MSDSLLKWIRPEIRALSAYHVAEAGKLIKLDAMENPYSLPAEDQTDLLAGLSEAEINRYPDPEARALKRVLKQLMQVPAGTSMILGNGSDELIQMLAMAVAEKDRCIMSFEPGFVMYRMIAEFVGMRYEAVELDDNFEINLTHTLKQIDRHQPAIIFIAYPNNPTANCFHKAAIEEIIKAAPGIVVVDEAYHPFAQDTFMDSLTEYDHLMVMRTVSKMGLAGLRLGALCGHPLLVGEIDKVRLPYNINVLTQKLATAILKKPQALEQQAAEIREQREAMLKTLAAIDSIVVYPSQANFILFRLSQHDAGDVFERIKSQGVLIKNMKATQGALQNCLRVTVGTPAENEVFIRALDIALK